jgi:hypothetical protein
MDRKPQEVVDPLDWVRVATQRFGSRGMHRGITDPGQVLSVIYTHGMISRLEKKLEQAEAMAKGVKVKKRLAMVRMEVEYLKHVSSVNYLYNAYRISEDETCLDRLLDGIDAWNDLLDSFYDEKGRMKPLVGWPELRPFRGARRPALSLVTARWWVNKEKENNPFAWDTGEMRIALQDALIKHGPTR